MEIFIPKWVIITFIIIYGLNVLFGWVKWWYDRKIEKLKAEIDDRLTK